ncbi:hypothetical protein T484DRAFT_1820257 [Baffinella frigidus]|nr:hypothetical protein T484DRAFT_1820257 [Cryptophyta sp. CCMP2293]
MKYAGDDSRVVREADSSRVVREAAVIKYAGDDSRVVREVAVSLIPVVALKGEATAVNFLVDRLLDWALQDTPGTLGVTVVAGKGFPVAPGSAELRVHVQVKSMRDDVSIHTEPKGSEAKPHFNTTLDFPVHDPDEAMLIVTVLYSMGCFGATVERFMGSATVKLCEVIDDISTAPRYLVLLSGNGDETVGSVSLKYDFKPSGNIGLREVMRDVLEVIQPVMRDVLEVIEPVLLDEDFETRILAIQTVADLHYSSHKLSRMLLRTLSDENFQVACAAAKFLCEKATARKDQRTCREILDWVFGLLKQTEEPRLRGLILQATLLDPTPACGVGAAFKLTSSHLGWLT